MYFKYSLDYPDFYGGTAKTSIKVGIWSFYDRNLHKFNHDREHIDYDFTRVFIIISRSKYVDSSEK